MLREGGLYVFQLFIRALKHHIGGTETFKVARRHDHGDNSSTCVSDDLTDSSLDSGELWIWSETSVRQGTFLLGSGTCKVLWALAYLFAVFFTCILISTW
jgi:hypothetical protein